MPTYAYRGSACTHEFETVQKFVDAPLTECIECGGPVRRVFHPVGVVFKGSGWYINDSRPAESGSSTSDPNASSPKSTTSDSKDKETAAKSASSNSTTSESAKSSVKAAVKAAD